MPTLFAPANEHVEIAMNGFDSYTMYLAARRARARHVDNVLAAVSGTLTNLLQSAARALRVARVRRRAVLTTIA